MDDPNKHSSQQTDTKNVLPDVVHSQQIPVLGAVVSEEAQASEIAIDQETSGVVNVEDVSEAESISEHVPSKLEYSVSESLHGEQTPSLLKLDDNQDGPQSNASLNVVITPTPRSETLYTQDFSKHSISLPLDINAVSDIQLLSEESPIMLPLTCDNSNNPDDKSATSVDTPTDNQTPRGSPRSEYLDSLNEESSNSTISAGGHDSLEKNSSNQNSSSSEEIIKLDIRGQAAKKISLTSTDIIFGLPPEGSTVLPPSAEPLPVFHNLLSPFLVNASDHVKIQEVFDYSAPQSKEITQRSGDSSLDKPEECDDVKEFPLDSDVTPQNEFEERNEDCERDKDDKVDDASIPTQPKSMAPEETMSFSTLTTDYKTICEEYHSKLVHLEDAITQRDQLIEELTVSLQRAATQQHQLKLENEYLTSEVQNLQQVVSEQSISDHDTIKAQISDFMKYQSMIKDDSTKFYSALMSGGSSLQSSNGEKDMEKEEITINHSRSDLVKTSESSDEFQVGFENKLVSLVSKFDEYIEENMRNKLREGLVQILCDEIGKMRLDFDTDLKELETQMQQDQQAYTKETSHLRELLSTVKAGNVDIETLRKELNIKHEKEMANLRMYFEKKCSDMERSYSEDVWRGRVCESPVWAGAGEAEAAGDYVRRARSADLPSLTDELSKPNKKLDQLDDLRAEHSSYVTELKREHRENIVALQAQISQLKAQLQSTDNTEAKLSLYQQDIDLELEKAAQLEKRFDEVRQEVVQELQDKIQVLLSDPDAESSSWPLELVALRDKIHGDARLQQEKELSSLGQSPTGEADKWRQRRNNSFDQNRQLEEITKERDGLRRKSSLLELVVGQLMQYCCSAEHELNTTVLATLIPASPEASRPSSPSTQLAKHVHFAPSLSVLQELGAELEAELGGDRDVSSQLHGELQASLARLRGEAQQLLQLALNRGVGDKSRMLESSQLQITELVDEIDAKSRICENCDLHKKCMQEAMSECIERENLLRSELEAALLKIAALMTACDNNHSTEIVAEGYGAARAARRPRPPEPARGPSSPPSPPSGESPSPSPRPQLRAALDEITRERDDLQQQLEAANRKLQSTRQFVEEQSTEREAERDEFAARIQAMKEENTRLTARLQSNARILTEMYGLLASARRNHLLKVEQLEAQSRELTQAIVEVESRKCAAEEEARAAAEQVSVLREVVKDLETRLRDKADYEAQILKELEIMKQTIDERDNKMRSLLQELTELKLDRDTSDVTACLKCAAEEDRCKELADKFAEECGYLEEHLYRRVRILERLHDEGSRSCSEHSEDVSIREQRMQHRGPRPPSSSQLSAVWEVAAALSRAEDAAVKKLADADMHAVNLKDVAQEIRAERDVLQARMSEQALRISSLSARLEQQRNEAAAAAHTQHSQLSVQLSDAQAEVQRLKDELDSKDKQLTRAKLALEERGNNQHTSYGNSCNPRDKIPLLERELSSAQSRIAQLESLASSLEHDKEQLQNVVRELERTVAEKEDQLQELLAIKLDDEQKDKADVDAGKISARTLSDIVSISEFDEQDLQMRRAELKAHNLSLTGAPYVDDTREKSNLNRTMPPDLQKLNMSSLNIDYHDNFDIPSYTPRADSLPAHLTSTQNKDMLKQYKRNINETTVFGNVDQFGDNVKHSTAQKIPDNCSMYPNRDVSDSKNVSIEPKKINFSLEASKDNKNEDMSLRELGITLDVRQENFPAILTKIKQEIKKLRTELEKSKSELKNAEEQLCEFPALKEEVEELKGLLENTMATMENDKKFYENQLESFSSNKKLLEQRLTELTQEVNDKTKDLHLLKEDILRRENMVLELAKEKRNLTNKLAELEVKIDELERANNKLENTESENRQLKDKLTHLQKLEQLISEKNQQIDSLNQHLDRLDDLQRCLNDKTEEIDNVKEALDEKTNEVFQLQNTVQALTEDIAKAHEENSNLNTVNKDLKLTLTKLEKENENASIKLQSHEGESLRLNSINAELTFKIEELKLLTDKLKDKETEIEILNEDINAFHEEIASLKDQLQMVSRSPSPRNKIAVGEDKRQTDRQASNDKKQLVKIRKQISLLQHELDFNKKELNDKAFELAKAKLDVTELRNNLSQASKLTSDKETASSLMMQQIESLQREVTDLRREKKKLEEQLEVVVVRLREESNVEELKMKLQEKLERCHDLEIELQDMKDLLERAGLTEESPARALVPSSGRRSPTAELEGALRDTVTCSRALDHSFMQTVLSAGAGAGERDVPPLLLEQSYSSSVHSSSSAQECRLRNDNEKLTMQLNHLEARLKDKDALITELNTIRDKLVQDWQSVKLRLEAERENSDRLKLLLDKQKHTAESLQNQDSSMIQMLKKRLESAMRTELEARQREQELRSSVVAQGGASPPADSVDRLKGEVSILKSRLACERDRSMQLESELERARNSGRRELEQERDKNGGLLTQLATLKRQKHEVCMELVRTKELVNCQSRTIADLENNINLVARTRSPIASALTEIEGHKSELAREIASLKQCLAQTHSPEPRSDAARNRIQDTDDKDHAIRYLHGRCLRLESCRKALVWQKRYLLRVVGGYHELERRYPATENKLRGKARFKCVVTAVVAVCRMWFVVRRRLLVRSTAARCLLAPRPGGPRTASTSHVAESRPSPLPASYLHSPSEHYVLNSPRGEVAAAYINKLNQVSRCLNRAMDAAP